MAAQIGSPLGIVLPTVGGLIGTWGQLLNTGAFQAIIDAIESGVGSTLGLTIDGNLDCNDFPLVNCGAVLFTPITSPAFVNNMIFTQDDGELHFIDEVGNNVQITSGGLLNAAGIGGINGDYGAGDPADVSYLAATSVFTFSQDPGVPASLDIGQLKIREPVLSSNGITIKSPTSLASSYSITLPSGLPASTSVWTVSSTGVSSLTRALTLDSATIASMTAPVANIDALADAGEIDLTTSGGGSGDLGMAGNLTLTGVNKTVHAPRIQTDEADIRHGSRRILISCHSGQLDTTAAGYSGIDFAPGALKSRVPSGGGDKKIYFDIVAPSGSTLTTVMYSVLDGSSTPHPYMKLWKVTPDDPATAVQIGSTQTASSGGLEQLFLTGLTESLNTSFRYVLEVGWNNSGYAIYSGYYEYSRP